MRISRRFRRNVAAAVALLVAAATAADASTRKGDKLFAQGRKAEDRKEWDKALDFYEQALSEDPADQGYRLATQRVRFQASEYHVKQGLKLRESGQLDQALAQFEKAYAIDPSSAIAEQELKRTLEMIRRNQKEGAALTPEERTLTPAELDRKAEQERLARIEPPPMLKALSQQPINLRMTNQPARVLFETLGKLAGINVIFDPEYRNDANTGGRNASIDLINSSLEDALDDLAMTTKSFWKPLSPNAIFVTADNMGKRRDYEDSVVKVFYLSNLTTPQELQEITTTLRTVADIRKVFTYTTLNAIIVRGTSDQVLLAEKLVNDLDKPKAEVVVDVMLMEANRTKTRNLAATLIGADGNPGLNFPIGFTPRASLVAPTPVPVATPTPEAGATPFPVTGTGTSGTSSAGTPITLSQIRHITGSDFSITMPGALFQAAMTDVNARVLQSPQVRASNGQKASLRIGTKVPIASGGVQPFGTTVGAASSLYTQFQFIDVGVNVDITPTVHYGSDEVTLKLVLEVSAVTSNVNIGGITQPVISQDKIEHEIRIKEGEVSLIAGLMQEQSSKNVAGVPGLTSIPGLKHLFSSNNTSRGTDELIIVLIPHIVRTPGITEVNLRSIAAGTDPVVKVSLAPPAPAPAQPSPSATPAPPAPETTAAPQAPPPAPAPAAQFPPELRLLLSPPAAQVNAGATFTLELRAEDAHDLIAAPFHLKFDPQVVRLEEVKQGNLLSSDGKTVIFTRNILNDTGDCTVNLNRKPGDGGISGSGALAVFTFQAIKPGSTTVTFSELGALDSRLQPFPLRIPQAIVTVK